MSEKCEKCKVPYHARITPSGIGEDCQKCEVVQTALAEKDAEIARLRSVLGVVKRNIKAGVVNLFWVRDFVTKALEPHNRGDA